MTTDPRIERALEFVKQLRAEGDGGFEIAKTLEPDAALAQQADAVARLTTADRLKAILREPASPSETSTEQGWALRRADGQWYADAGDWCGFSPRPNNIVIYDSEEGAAADLKTWDDDTAFWQRDQDGEVEVVQLTRAITVTLTPQPQTPEPTL